MQTSGEEIFLRQQQFGIIQILGDAHFATDY